MDSEKMQTLLIITFIVLFTASVLVAVSSMDLTGLTVRDIERTYVVSSAGNILEVSSDGVSECCKFSTQEGEKTCAALKGQDCSVCDAYCKRPS